MKTIEQRLGQAAAESNYELIESAATILHGNRFDIDDDLPVLQRLLEDFTTVVRCLLLEHSANAALRDPAPSTAGRCDCCGADWPCATYRRLDELLNDPERTFSQVRDEINQLYPIQRTRTVDEIVDTANQAPSCPHRTGTGSAHDATNDASSPATPSTLRHESGPAAAAAADTRTAPNVCACKCPAG